MVEVREDVEERDVSEHLRAVVDQAQPPRQA